MDTVKDGDVEIILPTVYGLESVETKRSSRQVWGETDYFSKLEAFGDDAVEVIISIYEFSKSNGAVFNFGTGSLPSVNARFQVGQKVVTVWSSYLQKVGPTVDINFEYFGGIYPNQNIEAMRVLLESIPGVEGKFSTKSLEEHPRPSLPVAKHLTKEGAVETLIEALGKLLS